MLIAGSLFSLFSNRNPLYAWMKLSRLRVNTVQDLLIEIAELKWIVANSMRSVPNRITE